MLYLITHLKAPWPVGTKVGDVIELAAVPVWAVGKCREADEGAEATVSMPDPALAIEAAQPAEQAMSADQVRDAAQRFIDDMRSQHAAEMQTLQGQVDALTTKLAATETDDGKASAALAEAEAQAAAEKADLEAKAAASHKPKHHKG